VGTLDGAQNAVPSFITLHGPVREARFIANPDGMPDGGVHNLFVISGRPDAKGAISLSSTLPRPFRKQHHLSQSHNPQLHRQMNHHLREISSQVGTAAHAPLVLTPAPAEAGGARWHDSQALAIPDNITLLALPPYSPQLNPVERIWHYLRSHWLANSVFRSLADIMGRLRDGVEPLRRRPQLGPFAVRRRLGAWLAPGFYTSAIHPDPTC
jgi:DDE superfamily endonuclease